MNNFLGKIFFRKRINPARRIVLGFALLIFAGTLLMMLPASSKTGEAMPFITALFTSTSATCVTGLSILNVGAELSLFGQFVLLALIQTGGLGFMMILCVVFLVLKKRMGIRGRIMIANSVGIDSVEGIVALAKHVIGITGIIEGIGAVILSARFIPRFGVLRGIWFGIFHSVSAFCNAGFDLIGDGKSMLSCKHDPVVLMTLAVLVIIGGLGFIVWEEIIRRRSRRKLSMYTRVVLITTAILLLSGTALFFALEYRNPDTIGGENIIRKLTAAFFQSVTTRTAGFDAVGQSNLTEQSKIVGIILMMIGGASGSTAGGIKAGTAALVVLSLVSVVRARESVVIFGRRIAPSLIIHALSLFAIWLVLTVTGAVLVSSADGKPLLDAAYEVASAYSTVGLSVGVTETASLFTKLLFIVYMFFGRVGIMTISVVFMARSAKAQTLRYPDGDFMIG